MDFMPTFQRLKNYSVKNRQIYCAYKKPTSNPQSRAAYQDILPIYRIEHNMDMQMGGG